VVVSDDPAASERIASFAAGSGEWLVAVRMVSEGVDIPRLRVGVYASTTTTDLFFRQAVGRLVRWTPGVPEQRAWLYLPDDARLRTWAALIAEQRRHSLARDARRQLAESAERATSRAPEEEIRGMEQMSLFAPLSAVATDVAAMSPWHEPLPDEWTEADARIEVALAAPPSLVDGPVDGQVSGTRREAKDALRAANATAARDLARQTGLSHAQINAELNRVAGLRRITEATGDQLERRLRHAEGWLARTSG